MGSLPQRLRIAGEVFTEVPAEDGPQLAADEPVVLGGGVACVLLYVSEGGSWGWTAGKSIAYLAVGVILLAGFVPLERDIDPANADPLKTGLSVVQRFMGIGEAEHHLGKGTIRFDGNTEYVGIAAHGSHTHLDGDELAAAEERQGVTVRAGDALIVHTGNVAYALQEKDRRPYSPQARLHAACRNYLRERDIAALGSDSIQDVQPSGFDTLDLLRPIHIVGLVALGLWLIDNMQLTELAGTCADQQRWEFLFTMLPWRFVGITSSATNPVAVL